MWHPHKRKEKSPMETYYRIQALPTRQNTWEDISPSAKIRSHFILCQWDPRSNNQWESLSNHYYHKLLKKSYLLDWEYFKLQQKGLPHCGKQKVTLISQFITQKCHSKFKLKQDKNLKISYHIRQRNIEEHASSKGKYNIWSKIIAHQDAKS